MSTVQALVHLCGCSASTTPTSHSTLTRKIVTGSRSNTVALRVHASGLEIAETGGDGVYLRWAKDISMGGVTTQGAYRNGLSVIGRRRTC